MSLSKLKPGDRVRYLGNPNTPLARRMKSTIDNLTMIKLADQEGEVVEIDGPPVRDVATGVMTFPSIKVKFDNVAFSRANEEYLPEAEFERV